MSTYNKFEVGSHCPAGATGDHAARKVTIMQRLRTPSGDWYVETPDREWPAAIARMKRAVEARDKRMRSWEKTQPDGARFEPGYWERYSAAKAADPIDYPMPAGHVMFARKRAS
jgi:hypothetical protein